MATADHLGLPSDEYGIRRATSRDIPHLGSIELNAASLFSSIPALAWIAEAGDTLPLSTLTSACRAGTLWVATYGGLPDDYDYDTPIAFLCASMLDGGLYINEVSVNTHHQTRGLGRLLVRTAEEHARVKGLPRVSLSTDRFVSWNGPWYARQGYRETSAELVGPEHHDIVEKEEAHGFDMNRRSIMIKNLRSDHQYED